MKYYSEILNQMYESEEMLIKDEESFKAEQAAKEAAEKEKIENRKARAKEVEDAYKVYTEAGKAYEEKLRAFCKDFGPYHMSIKMNDIGDIFNRFFGF